MTRTFVVLIVSVALAACLAGYLAFRPAPPPTPNRPPATPSTPGVAPDPPRPAPTASTSAAATKETLNDRLARLRALVAAGNRKECRRLIDLMSREGLPALQEILGLLKTEKTPEMRHALVEVIAGLLPASLHMQAEQFKDTGSFIAAARDPARRPLIEQFQEETGATLLALVKDELDEPTRAAALSALASCPTAASLSEFLTLLHDDHVSVSAYLSASKALERILDPAAIPLLRTALSPDLDSTDKERIQNALAAIGTDESVALLLTTSPDMEQLAITQHPLALAEIKKICALDAGKGDAAELLGAFPDDPFIRERARRRLDDPEESLVSKLRLVSGKSVSWDALRAWVLDAYRSGDSSDRSRIAGHVLHAIAPGDPIAAELAALERNPEQRFDLLCAAGDEASAEESLRAALKAGKGWVMTSDATAGIAAETRARWREMAREILPTLTEHRQRLSLAMALSWDSENPAEEGASIAGLYRPELPVKDRCSILFITRLSSPEALAPLLPTIIRFSSSADAEERKEGLACLAASGRSEARQALRDAATRNLAETLPYLGKGGIPPVEILRLGEGGSTSLRTAMIASLGDCQDRAGSEEALINLASRETSPDLVQAIVGAFGKVGTRSTLRRLEALRSTRTELAEVLDRAIAAVRYGLINEF